MKHLVIRRDCLVLRVAAATQQTEKVERRVPGHVWGIRIRNVPNFRGFSMS